MVDPMDAGGPYKISIIGNDEIILENVMVGDVWLAAGQSNMEFGMKKINNWEEEIASANNNNIRLLSGDRSWDFEPQEDINTKGWQVCTPKTLKLFSAVGYLFGKELYETYNIPIGIIDLAIGGTVAEAWMELKVSTNYQSMMVKFSQLLS